MFGFKVLKDADPPMADSNPASCSAALVAIPAPIAISSIQFLLFASIFNSGESPENVTVEPSINDLTCPSCL